MTRTGGRLRAGYAAPGDSFRWALKSHRRRKACSEDPNSPNPARASPSYSVHVITTVAISGYRSLRDLVLPLDRLNVVTGANGSGKSSLYRALRLLGEAALNSVVSSLAREGGLPSTLWAGPETIARSVRQGDHPVQGTAP